MRKLLCIILSIIMVLSLFACGKKKNEPEETDEKTTSEITESPSKETQSGDLNNETNNNKNDDQNNQSNTSNTDNNSNNNIGDNNSDDNNSDSSNDDNNDNQENNESILEPQEKKKITSLLSELLGGYKINPLALIPSTMRETNANKVTEKGNIPTDYSNSVSVSSIPNTGIGAQWKMVLDNLNQTNIFFNALRTADNIIISSTSYITEFFEEENVTSTRYTFNINGYTITVDYDGTNVYYVMNLGTVQIAMTMNSDTKLKTVRIQLTDTNALAYTIDGTTYTFAISYVGVRQAYVQIKKASDNSIEGHIYEYAIAHKFANFYINDDYVTVIGDALDNNVLSDDYVVELYDTKTRELLAFETQETVGIINKKQVATVWLNLRSITGINSISYGKLGTDEEKGFYLNGSSSQWVAGEEVNDRPTFDIELIDQYFFYLDGENYKDAKEEVPMFRIQAASLSNINSIVKALNPSADLSVNLSNTHLNKLTSDYAKYVNDQTISQSKISSEQIIALVGNKIVFN